MFGGGMGGRAGRCIRGSLSRGGLPGHGASRRASSRAAASAASAPAASRARPVLTAALTSCALSMAGDLVAQACTKIAA